MKGNRKVNNASYFWDDSVCSSVKSNDLLEKKCFQWNAEKAEMAGKAGMENKMLIDDKYKIAILL
jgi:hypothetical protein